jgi:hypothetical protein
MTIREMNLRWLNSCSRRKSGTFRVGPCVNEPYCSQCRNRPVKCRITTYKTLTFPLILKPAGCSISYSILYALGNSNILHGVTTNKYLQYDNNKSLS